MKSSKSKTFPAGIKFAEIECWLYQNTETKFDLPRTIAVTTNPYTITVTRVEKKKEERMITDEKLIVVKERILQAISKCLQWKDGEISGLDVLQLEQRISGILDSLKESSSAPSKKKTK